MRKRVTMTDVGVAAGVSQATVSLVFSGEAEARISTETRRRVLQAARTLGYQKTHRLVRAAAGVPVIGFLIDEVIPAPFAIQLIAAARDEAELCGCIISVFCTRGNPALEEAALGVLSATQLQGVVYAALVTRTVSPPERLREIPAILLNCHDALRKFNAVLPADLSGAFVATEALLKAGHRRIAHLAGETWMEAARDRELGYRRALSSRGLPVDPELIIEGSQGNRIGDDVATRLLEMADRPTALFCFNDRLAVRACDAIRSLALRIPDEMSVICFNEEGLASYVRPPLSTVELPHEEMARYAVSALLDLSVDSPVANRVKIECSFVPRQSIAEPQPLIATAKHQADG